MRRATSSTVLQPGERTSSARNTEPPLAGSIRAIHFVAPAYNEEASLQPFLDRLYAFTAAQLLDVTVWVVNDGSMDRTAEIAKSSVERYADVMTIVLVDHVQNLGLGQAVRSGLVAAMAAADEEDAVVVLDADDTHDVEIVPEMVRCLERGADIAIASRFVRGGDDRTAPLHRRVVSRVGSFVFATIVPVDGIHDFTSGFRAYRISLLRRAADHYGERLVEEHGFAVMVELLLKLRYCAPVIVEVPMVLRYDRKGSASKLKLWRTVLQYVNLMARDRLTPAPFRTL